MNSTLFNKDTYYLIASFNNWFPILLDGSTKSHLKIDNKSNSYENFLK